MAWTKIPPENHALFQAALPDDPRIETLKMFGGFAAKINGNLFGGTFGRSVMLLLSESDRTKALALAGAAPFDPMGNGAVRSDKVQMPEAMMADAAALRAWIRRSFDYAATLPAKSKKASTSKTTPAKRGAANGSRAKAAVSSKVAAAKPTRAKAMSGMKKSGKKSGGTKSAANRR